MAWSTKHSICTGSIRSLALDSLHIVWYIHLCNTGSRTTVLGSNMIAIAREISSHSKKLQLYGKTQITAGSKVAG
ncbi:hypothetical protein AJ78_01362 [Emergomyces pasteurianus Ep9510]|uniref:Uncharacterized protein n=1 Tax=Emergomyces pasteurianus Ep9510 TaxID=1447872 RepID=A0A1J9PRW9_9EURO|nr:hypothetical protein AJ78_01362 [Emergomyces pasteurianus Ep9510]